LDFAIPGSFMKSKAPVHKDGIPPNFARDHRGASTARDSSYQQLVRTARRASLECHEQGYGLKALAPSISKQSVSGKNDLAQDTFHLILVPTFLN
jgi:hypothetical protein